MDLGRFVENWVLIVIDSTRQNEWAIEAQELLLSTSGRSLEATSSMPSVDGNLVWFLARCLDVLLGFNL
jgi:hypothetical protein